MQIYIAKPGGQKEGPFTVEQINRDLASNRYRESDYWAWYEGLPQWAPLHSIPGIAARFTPPAPAPEPRRVAVAPKPAAAEPHRQATPAQAIPDVFTKSTPPAEKKSERPAQPSTDIFRKARAPEPAAQPSTDIFRRAKPPEPAAQSNTDTFRKARSPEPAAQSNTEVFRRANKAAQQNPADPMPDVFAKVSPPAEKKAERAAQPNTDVFRKSNPVAERKSDQITDVFAKANSTATSSGRAQSARSPGVSKLETSSGLPFSALEQIFIFTSGEGRNIFQSSIVAQKLQEATGEVLSSIRGKIPVSVIGRADVGVEMMIEGSIPEKAWRAMFAIKPAMAQKAKEEQVQICVRTFSVEAQDSVALFLLYSKEKMQLAHA